MWSSILPAGILVCVAGTSGLVITPQKPLRTGGGSGNLEVDAPGIGIDLSNTYGTASIKYGNGTVIDVGKVQGNWEYTRLMGDLGKEGRPFEPPFESQFDAWKWQTQQVQRRVRKLRGLPATEEIGFLADMISALQYAVQDKLAYPLTQATVTTPYLPRLLDSDLEEAFGYTGIKLLKKNMYGGLDEIVAARVGMGYGLCSNPDDYKSCRDEEYAMPIKNTVAVGFTNASLTVTNLVIYRGHYMSRGFWQKNDVLGFNNWMDLPEAEFYDHVSADIKANAGFRHGDIEEIILYGEAAEEKKFLDAVWKALGDLEDAGGLAGRAADLYSVVQVPAFSALYTAARGAAELARRAQGVSGDCVEVVDTVDIVDEVAEDADNTVWYERNGELI